MYFGHYLSNGNPAVVPHPMYVLALSLSLLSKNLNLSVLDLSLAVPFLLLAPIYPSRVMKFAHFYRRSTYTAVLR